MTRAERIEAAAREALDACNADLYGSDTTDRVDAALDALRDALAEPDRMTATECVAGVQAALKRAAATIPPIEFSWMKNAYDKAVAMNAIADRCTFCGGLGWAVERWNTCPVCRGTGRATPTPDPG